VSAAPSSQSVPYGVRNFPVKWEHMVGKPFIDVARATARLRNSEFCPRNFERRPHAPTTEEKSGIALQPRFRAIKISGTTESKASNSRFADSSRRCSFSARAAAFRAATALSRQLVGPRATAPTNRRVRYSRSSARPRADLGAGQRATPLSAETLFQATELARFRPCTPCTMRRAPGRLPLLRQGPDTHDVPERCTSRWPRLSLWS